MISLFSFVKLETKHETHVFKKKIRGRNLKRPYYRDLEIMSGMIHVVVTHTRSGLGTNGNNDVGFWFFDFLIKEKKSLMR